MTATSNSITRVTEFRAPADPALHLLGLHLASKRTEQSARAVLGDALAGPGAIVPYFWQAWMSTRSAEKAVYREIRRTCKRVVIPMVGRSAAA